MSGHRKDSGYSWLIVLASFVIQFIGLGINSTFGIYYIEISKEYPEEGKSGVSWVPSIMTAFAHAVGPFASYLVNNHGLRLVSITGSLLCSGGFAISYFAPSVGILDLTVGVAGGIGLGFMYLPSVVSIPRNFEKKLALATAVCICGSGLGTMFFEWSIGEMLAHLNWRTSLLITGGIFLLTGPLGLLYNPSPDTEIDEMSDPLLSPSPHNQNLSCKRRKTLLVDLCLFKNILFLLFSLSEVFASFGFNIPQVYLPEIEHTMSNSDSNTLLGFIAGPMILSRLLLGYLSDKKWVNRHLHYTIALALMGIATAVSPHLQSIALLRVYSAIFGICVGIYLGLKSVILLDLVGQNKFTDSFGLLLLIQTFGMLFGAPIAGYFYDLFGTYAGGFYFSGIMFLFSALVLTFIPRARRKIEKDRKLIEDYVNRSQTCMFVSKDPAGYSTFTT